MDKTLFDEIVRKLANTNSRESLFHQNVRHTMIEDQLRDRGIMMESLLKSMFEIPRERFIPSRFVANAYEDIAIPLGHNRSLYQPYLIALMVESADLSPNDQVLEIGTGCGYQTAILSELVNHLVTWEYIDELHERSIERLIGLGFLRPDAAPASSSSSELHQRTRITPYFHPIASPITDYGNTLDPMNTLESLLFNFDEDDIGQMSSSFLPPQLLSHAPYDAIIINPILSPQHPTNSKSLPKPLLKQLRMNGRLVYPVYDPRTGLEELVRLTRVGPNSYIEEVIMENNLFHPAPEPEEDMDVETTYEDRSGGDHDKSEEG